MKKLWTKKTIFWASSRGFYFTCIPFMACFIFASIHVGAKKAYFQLLQWDSYHYIDIVERGYQVPFGLIHPEDIHSNRANVAFFPAYPLLAEGIHHLGIPTSIALLMVAHFFCFIFWFLFFLLAKFWQIPKQSTISIAIAVAFYPASFYLIMGYSESLFMAALLGFILWTELWIAETQSNRFNVSWILASVSGFCLTSTRLVGLPLMLYPLIRLARFRAALLSSIAALGGLSFFGWCQFQFGEWNLYFKLQQLGWDNHPNYLAILNPSSYIPRFFFEDTVTSVCRASNALILFIFLLLARLEFQKWKCFKKSHNRSPWELYFSAFSLFYISISGKANAHMDSMVRYNLPVFVILILAITQINPTKEPIVPAMTHQSLNKLIILGYFLAITVQIWMAYLFTKGGWVA